MRLRSMIALSALVSAFPVQRAAAQASGYDPGAACAVLGTCAGLQPNSPPRSITPPPPQRPARESRPDGAQCRRMAEQRDGPLLAEFDKAARQYQTALDNQKTIGDIREMLDSTKRGTGYAASLLGIAHRLKITTDIILALGGAAAEPVKLAMDAGDLAMAANGEEAALEVLKHILGPVGDAAGIIEDRARMVHDTQSAAEVSRSLTVQVANADRAFQKYRADTASFAAALRNANAQKNDIDKACGSPGR